MAEFTPQPPVPWAGCKEEDQLEFGVTSRPFMPWVGSKEKLLPYIYQVFPPQFDPFLDPFCGSGAVLLGLPSKKGRKDIINDLDANLTNLFLCVKENPGSLLKELRFLPIHSRAVFDLYKDLLEHREIHWSQFRQAIRTEQDLINDREFFTEEQARELQPILDHRASLFDVKRACMYYQNVRGSFSGVVDSFGLKALNLANFLYLIETASKRLQCVAVENQDAITLIRARDRPGALIYCDPPYFEAEDLYSASRKANKTSNRNSRRKKHQFHIHLWKVLSECKGWVVLSYNDCPFIRTLYQNYYILAFSRANPLAHREDAEYGELIITNYDPRPYMTRQLTLFENQLDKWEMELVHIPEKPTRKENQL